MEELLDSYGIGYRLRTDQSFTSVFLENVRYLMGFLRQDTEKRISLGVKERLQELYTSNVVFTFAELLENIPDMTVDDVLGLITAGQLFFDIHKVSLKNRDSCQLVDSPDVLLTLSLITADYQTPLIDLDQTIAAGDEVALSGNDSIYTVISMDIDQCVLVDDAGRTITFQMSDLEKLKQKKQLKHSPKDASNNSQIFKTLSDEAFKRAVDRFHLVKALLNGATYAQIKLEYDVSERTARRYKKKYLQSQQICGDGFLGLLDEVGKRGNRQRRIETEILDAVSQFIEEEFLDYKGMKISQAYHSFLVKHEGMSLSYETFRRCVAELETQNIIHRREGYKRGRSARSPVEVIDYGTPVNGSRAFEVAHIDHTQIDVEVFCAEGGESIRPWLTVMIDAYTRMILAFSISLLHPSRLSCMNILRECVINHERLPEVLVVDGGKEFESQYFERLCARYEVEIRSRRCNPRKGAVVERMFGVTNSRLFHQMVGNTKLMKDTRGMTKRNNPRNLAIWTLEALETVCGEFFYDIYANKTHTATGEAPLASLQRSMVADGERKHRRITDRRAFFFDSMIPVNQETRTVQPSRGVKVQGNYFWCDIFSVQRNAGKAVPVKVDFFNTDVVACFVDGQWHICRRVSGEKQDDASKFLFDVESVLTPKVTGQARAKASYVRPLELSM